MSKYTTVLFDLDGTITDPGIGITNSIMYALKKYNIEVKERAKLYRFIGPPLIDSFQNYYGFSKEKAVQAVDYYREYYADKGIYENYLYDGIKKLLKKLRDDGIQTVLATSKPEVYAKRILEHFEVDEYFSYVAGANFDESRSKKDEVIEYALKLAGVDDKSRVVMVGDREYDILGAKKVGIDSIGVLYGYGNIEELSKAGAVYIAENVTDIYQNI